MSWSSEHDLPPRPSAAEGLPDPGDPAGQEQLEGTAAAAERSPLGTPLSAQDFLLALSDDEDEPAFEQTYVEQIASKTVDDLRPLEAPTLHLPLEPAPEPAFERVEVVEPHPTPEVVAPGPGGHDEPSLRLRPEPAPQPRELFHQMVQAPQPESTGLHTTPTTTPTTNASTGQPRHKPAPVPLQPATAIERPKSSRWLPVIAAVLVGGIAGLGATMLVDRSLNGNEDEPTEATPQDDQPGTAEPAEPATTDDSGQALVQGSVQDTVRADRATTDEPANSSTPAAQDPLGPALAAGDLPRSVNSIHFVPGTTDLTDDSASTVEALAQALADQPEVVVEGTLRTSSETTDADNQTLGQRQVTALIDRFTTYGASTEQLDLEPIGRAMVTVREPVPNFVEVRTGLGQSPLQERVASLPIYSIGIDPTTGELRAESIVPLGQLAEALLDDDRERSISLAAYAFTGADAATNDQLAARTAAVVENHLVEVYGIDSGRIDLIIVGDAPYAVPAEIGNQLFLRRVS